MCGLPPNVARWIQKLKLIAYTEVIADPSEMHFQGELQLPLRHDGGSNHSGCTGTIVDESIRQCKDWVIESVKHLEPELQVLAFGNIEHFAQ